MELKRFAKNLLLPVSLGYGGAVWVRNKLFDKNILRSASFNFPVICVGNLAVGGTGKTPMTEYLVRLLKQEFIVATLSRGYKRKTRGFAIATNETTAVEIGDEPMQLHIKFPDVTVAVAEERIVGIPQLLHEKPKTQVIILDDAFQHRAIKAGLNILLTDYQHLYTRSLPLPSGNLRDVKSSSKRAHIIVVTKCDSGMSDSEKQDVIKEIGPQQHQTVYFAGIEYGTPYHMFTGEQKQLNSSEGVVLVCGIANPASLEKELARKVSKPQILTFKDHHIFDTADLKHIKQAFANMKQEQKIILTTEKDAVRLIKFKKEMVGLPIYVIPMRHKILFDESDRFEKQVILFVREFK